MFGSSTLLGKYIPHQEAQELDTRDKWFKKLKEGYCGVQSGNSTILYFFDSDGRLHSGHLISRQELHEISFELRNIQEVYNALRTSRGYHIFRTEAIRSDNHQAVIRLIQGDLIPSRVNSKIPKGAFDDGLDNLDDMDGLL